MKNNACYLAPIYTLGFGFKQSPVCSQMLFIIDGQVPAPDGAMSSTVGSSSGSRTEKSPMQC